jgi:hypothetical protein
MKGTLMKTEQGWVVEYAKHAELPLHPEFIEMMDTCFTSKFTHEIEFEIVNETYDEGKECFYAKPITGLIDTSQTVNHIGEVNEMVCAFEPTTDTSSATICKHCGKEKFMHNHISDVGKMVDDYVYELAETYYGPGHYGLESKQGFIKGYTKAKETLYTEEQVREAMNCTVLSAKAKERVIQSLKQHKQ